MSGRALQGVCETQPIPDNNEYAKLRQDFINAINRNSVFRGRLITEIIQLTKILNLEMPHGDIDFIIDEARFEKTGVTHPQIAAAVGSKGWVQNGDVTSFEFQGHQIDFISVPAGTVSLNTHLRGHHGAGHLLRYLVRPYGYVLSRTGLAYRLMDGAEKVEDIQLFMDPSLLFSYFGLDAPGSYYNSFSYGFSSLEDAYKKIAGSTTFCLSAYDVNENLEYVGKPERLEYEAFRGFIEYLQTEGRDRIRRYGIHNWPLQPTELMKKQLEKTIDKYASKTGLVKQALARYTKRKLLRARFSGDVVMRATGLEPGNELGKFMEAYKKSFGSVGKFEFFVLSSGLETIADHVKAFYETWKNRSETEKVVEELVEAKSKNQEDLKNALNRSIAEYGPIVVNPHAVVTMTGI